MSFSLKNEARSGDVSFEFAPGPLAQGNKLFLHNALH